MNYTEKQQEAIDELKSLLNKMDEFYIKQRQLRGKHAEEERIRNKEERTREVNNLLHAIETKNEMYLISTIHIKGKFNLQFFEKFTGLQLGRTKKSISQNLKRFIQDIPNPLFLKARVRLIVQKKIFRPGETITPPIPAGITGIATPDTVGTYTLICQNKDIFIGHSEVVVAGVNSTEFEIISILTPFEGIMPDVK